MDPDKFYAVRSSANIENSLDRSFSGAVFVVKKAMAQPE
jgi:hypothetical protein